MDYRPLPEDYREQYKDFVQYAFSVGEGPQDEHGWDPDDQPGHPRALFDGDRMLCSCRHYWFRARLRDRWIELPGLSAVASPPEHRRQGHVTRLMVESLAEYRDRGDFLTALWAFEFPFYDRLGWGLANKTVHCECDPDALSFAREHASGRFRRVGLDEHELLDSILSADAEGYELEIDRSELWWQKRVFESLRAEPYVYVWENEGDARGYVVYRVHDEDDGQRLDVEEFAAADREARLNLLRFLSNHDSQVERVSLYGPHDTSLLDLVADPEAVECEVRPGPMVRLVDVPAAFEAFDYPDAPDAEFTVAVEDPLADWNDATFGVTVADGRATCERVADSSDDGETPDVTTDVGTLSQVVVGYHSVEDAEMLGDLEIRDSSVREALATMFPERDVFLREGF